ncbi:hypothetical protein NDS46_06755 [Paenibacillus thiaminolyticus]|uniref:hypothetical protein n=1 Tax=Paenibacillus thiaminolyticus TaxID=49283 RepID=UPI00232C61B4|nr:hypothetical protein [Paenibacillus thiaminolyticus]WCF09570.1 hypothetical protein NDS46_06755 [Paenibacillus thiaminolyticus]
MSDSSVLRRSLTPGQRAASVLEFAELVEELREGEKEQQGKRTDLLPELAKSKQRHTHVALAEKAGIGKSSMQYLMEVQRDEPELFEKVKSGEYTSNARWRKSFNIY